MSKLPPHLVVAARSVPGCSLLLTATLLVGLPACSDDPGLEHETGGAGSSGQSAGGSAGSASGGSSSGGRAAVGNGGSAGGNGGGASGGTGGSGGASTEPVPILFDETGSVLPNAVNIQGSWYTYSDGQDGVGSTNGRCEMAGHPPSDCSTITPAPGSVVTPSDLAIGKVCLSGVAARIANRIEAGDPPSDAGNPLDAGAAADAGTPDYGIIGAIGGTGLGQPYNAIANGVTGFSFDIDTPPSYMSVLVPTQASAAAGAPAAWGGATGASPVVAGTNSFRWADVGGPSWLPEPPPFDPTTIVTLLFTVSGDPDFARPFSFCVSNIKALRD